MDRDGNTIENGAFNSGTIQADGGKVLLTAHTAQKMVRSVVNNTGIIRRQSVSKRNGAIYLEAGPNGTATNEGTLDASGTDSGEVGGSVRILGHKVGQLGKSIIDVSGDQGGGEVLIGGDYQGKGTVQNALVTYGGSETTVKANAITDGDGGKVIYWADDTTRFFGAIEAKGGANSGDGGFVEISGKQFLDFNGEVITTAANGQTGTLLLDPQFIDVINGTADDDPEISTGSPLGEILAADGGSTASFQIGELTLEGLSSSTNIILEATDNITIQDLNDNELNLKQVAGHSVRFETQTGTIKFNDTNDLIRTNGGAVTFIAGSSLTMGKIESNGGDIDLRAGSTINASKEINSRGGAIALTAGSALTVGSIMSGGGAISLTGIGVNVEGDIRTGGGSYFADAGFGAYKQHSNRVVATAGGNAVLIADSFDLLNGFVTSDENIFGAPASIVTDTFSFIDGPQSGSITVEPFTLGTSVCIATTGCDIEFSQDEISSLRGRALNIGNLFTGDIDFGDVDLGHKEVNIISGQNITALGDKIIFHDDISLKAGGNINITSGSSFEAHISGFGKSFSATADFDQIEGR